MVKLKGVLCCYLVADCDVISTDSSIFASDGCLTFLFSVFVFFFLLVVVLYRLTFLGLSKAENDLASNSSDVISFRECV